MHPVGLGWHCTGMPKCQSTCHTRNHTRGVAPDWTDTRTTGMLFINIRPTLVHTYSATARFRLAKAGPFYGRDARFLASLSASPRVARCSVPGRSDGQCPVRVDICSACTGAELLASRSPHPRLYSGVGGFVNVRSLPSRDSGRYYFARRQLPHVALCARVELEA